MNLKGPESLPTMVKVRQHFPGRTPLDIAAEVSKQMEALYRPINSGASVAVGVGSRGITNYAAIARAVIDELKSAGAKPFLIPAMGSHGGATPEGQARVLADYGITEAAMGAPVLAAMESACVGQTESGRDVWFSKAALAADHVFVINRVKPHTDFFGKLGSGCLKMLTIGCGKREGAANYHQNAVRDGYEQVLRELGGHILRHLPILGGMAIVEDQRHQTAQLELLQPDNWIAREEALLEKARDFMPAIPFEDIDLLIVDRIGKNISGTGMDTNVIGRGVHEYTTLIGREQTQAPHIKRIYVRGLTPETHGNAIGVGMADFTHQRLVDAIDYDAMRINSLTSLTPHSAKVPIHFQSDREAIERALISAGVKDFRQARIIRIQDTLNLETILISESMIAEIAGNEQLEVDSDHQSALDDLTE